MIGLYILERYINNVRVNRVNEKICQLEKKQGDRVTERSNVKLVKL